MAEAGTKSGLEAFLAIITCLETILDRVTRATEVANL